MSRFENQSDWGIDAEWLVQELLDRDISIEQMSEPLSSKYRLKQGNYRYLPIDDYVALLGWAAKYLDCPHLGLELAANLHQSAIGIYGYLVGNSPTLGALLSAAEHYQSIFMRGMEWRMREVGTMCEIQWRIFRPYCEGTRQDIELTLAFLVQILRRKTGNHLTVEKAGFTHPFVEPLQPYTDAFGCEVLFEQATNSVLIDRSYLNLPLNDVDPKLLRILKQQADTLLAKWKSESSLVDKARFLIATSLEDDSGGVERLSQQLNITSRTLNRWFTRAGTNYKSLREEVLLEAAQQALIYSNASITLIAGKLGYSESSAFVRAFKRLTGYTPNGYRKTFATTSDDASLNGGIDTLLSHELE